MKVTAIIAVLLLLACVGGIAYLFLDCTITVTAVGAIAMEATSQPGLFDSLKAQIDANRVIGTVFRNEALQSADNYLFYTYTVRIRNNTFLAADMVELQITPMEGDVLQIAQPEIRTIPARSTGDVTATILTDVHAQPVREIRVTYYIWGMPFSMRTMYGGGTR